MYGRACSRYLGQRLVVAIGLCHKTLIPVAARVSVPRTLLPVQTRRFRDCGFHRFSTKVIEKQENGNDADLRHASTTEGDSNPRSETSIRTESKQLSSGEVESPSKKEACGDDEAAIDDDVMEEEEMFVEPPDFFQFKQREWGGPRRGGRFPEPTRYGDWERKGRCSDF